MATPSPGLPALQAVQAMLLALVEPLSEREVAAQFHPDLSPLGWHLGHCVFVEAFWIQRCLGSGSPPNHLQPLYAPEFSPKPLRSRHLPAKTELLAWARAQQQRHLAALANAAGSPQRLPGLTDLPYFLLQHHAQHLETAQMALAQRTASRPTDGLEGARLEPRPPTTETVLLPTGDYRLGSDHPGVYDNERPARRVRLPAARLGRQPVCNAEYLGFMQDGGYRRRQFWTDAGWHWRLASAAQQPAYWRRSADGGWLLLRPEGAVPLPAEGALIGISWFEAAAYAAWAGARLPHEYEWEAAVSTNRLAGVGTAWEWCRNRFHPYPGFRAFPYDGYSLPWFDGYHYTLRGGSPYSLPWIRRASFRNFYTADKRHVFAGCRLAFDA
ncbi:MAG TPA: SUMF1/EgtB/PvdO family nonheme iron enzyme [Gammaproteobacteria bacterium]|nr:SUMF1/EgtB/PvdO family nonheme iron enzyme [Gammaproteobacteria bacterium]